MAKAAAETTPIKKGDLSRYDPAKGFIGKELREFLGYSSSSFPTDAVSKGRAKFKELTAKRDPDGKAWNFLGHGDTKKFFRETSPFSGDRQLNNPGNHHA